MDGTRPRHPLETAPPIELKAAVRYVSGSSCRGRYRYAGKWPEPGQSGEDEHDARARSAVDAMGLTRIEGKEHPRTRLHCLAVRFESGLTLDHHHPRTLAHPVIAE